MILKFSLGWCRTKPVHELKIGKDGFIQCSELQNFIVRNDKAKKAGGTTRYNPSTILSAPIAWIKRSYHKLGDGSFVNRTLAFSNGGIYYGDDYGNTFTLTKSGWSKDSIPLDMTIQVSENSILYIFNGKDTPLKYDGNGSFTIEQSTLDSVIMAGVVYLDRAFYIKNNSSEVDYSEVLNPETIEDTIIAGNDRNSINLAIVVAADESLFIFRNNSIYQLYGRTPATFQLRLVTDKYGLASKRSICAVGSGFVFLNEFDKELYFFGGSESTIIPLTEEDIKLREIINDTADSINSVCMAVHDGLFRFAFQHRESKGDYNNCELVYCINEPRYGNLPKWSLVKGTNVLSYSVWNQQGDKNELVTGRSDVGLAMYHNRGLDFDAQAIECIAKTGEVTFSEGLVSIITDIFIKAKPGSWGTDSQLTYLLNGRFSDGWIQAVDMSGELKIVGVGSQNPIRIQKQSLFNDRYAPLSNYRRGNSVSFRFYDYHNGTAIELYSVAFNTLKRYKLRNQYV